MASANIIRKTTVKSEEFTFLIHGVGVTFTTHTPAIASAVRSYLQDFLQQSWNGSPTLNVLFQGVNNLEEIPIKTSPSAKRIFPPETDSPNEARPFLECDIYRDQGLVIADFWEKGRIAIDFNERKVEGYLVNPGSKHQDVIVRFIQIALAQLLKVKGLFTLHAAGLEKNGHGILITGHSGRGKTTSCLSLLRAGYRCLSDDYPLVRKNGGELELLGFPLTVNVTENTIGLFPELGEASADGVLHQGLNKRFFYVEDLYPGGMSERAKPAILLFPQVIDGPISSLEPLPKSRAFQEFLPNVLLVFDPQVAKQEFDAMSHLVQQVDCYRLYFGHDVLDLPNLVTPLLDKFG